MKHLIIVTRYFVELMTIIVRKVSDSHSSLFLAAMAAPTRLALLISFLIIISLSNAFDIGMKILVITTDGSQPSYTALINALNARGIPYDVHRTLYRGVFTGRSPRRWFSVIATVITVFSGHPFNFFDDTGKPKYYGIAFSHNMGYDPGTGYTYGISDAMLAKLKSYEEKYNVSTQTELFSIVDPFTGWWCRFMIELSP